MKGLRHFLRDFSATAVREHLRSQLEATDASPKLTKNEIELVRFIGEGAVDWRMFLPEGSARGEQEPTSGLESAPEPTKRAPGWM
jgi:hypothetical protein